MCSDQNHRSKRCSTSCWNVDLIKAMTTHTSLALRYSAGRVIMALSCAFHFSLMQSTVMSDVYKLLRMKNLNEKEYCTGEE